jgi:hypothetical protein
MRERAAAARDLESCCLEQHGVQPGHRGIAAGAVAP